MAVGTAPARPPDGAAAFLARPAQHQWPAQPARTAFYGRTNAAGLQAAMVLARQFRQCQDAAGHDAISAVFYDAAGGVSHALTQMVRQLEPLAACDGRWSDLAPQITSTDHPVTMIVCESPDRIARRHDELRARLHLLARHGVPLLLVGVFPREPLTADELERLTGITGLAWPRYRTVPSAAPRGGRPGER
jgi:hypothetical protein